MKYYKTLSDGKITELSKSDDNFLGSSQEITRTEYDCLILGIRYFLNNEDKTKIINDINGDGYYGD